MKKICVLICFSLLLSSIFTLNSGIAFAETNREVFQNKEISQDSPALLESGEILSPEKELTLNEPIFVNNTKVELIKSSPSYKEMKITNLEDNSVEFLESFINDGDQYMVSHSGSEKIQIELDEVKDKSGFTKEIKLTNLNNNKIERVQINKDIISAPEMSINSAADGYTYVSSKTGSAPLARATSSAAIAIIATIAGVHPYVTIAITIGTYFWSINAPHVYWLKGTWIKSYKVHQIKERTYTQFYKYHDLTGLQGEIINNRTYMAF